MSNTVGTVSCSAQDLVTRIPEKITIIVIGVSASGSTTASTRTPTSVSASGSTTAGTGNPS